MKTIDDVYDFLNTIAHELNDIGGEACRELSVRCENAATMLDKIVLERRGVFRRREDGAVPEPSDLYGPLLPIHTDPRNELRGYPRDFEVRSISIVIGDVVKGAT